MRTFFYIVFGGLGLLLVCFFVSKINFSSVTVQTYSAIEEEEDNINTTNEAPVSAITAKSYIIMDIDSGSIIVSNEPDTLMPIASLTKLVTAVIVRQYMPPDLRIIISKKTLNTYGNSAGFREGETFTVDDLLYPLLMVSSNDAAEALADAYNVSNARGQQQGRIAFMKAMNDFAQSIGAYRTYFADPAGLSVDSVSTAHDMAIILAWMKKNQPGLLDVTLQETKTLRAHTWVNPTHLLSWSYYIGGKNGYTMEANRTGAALFKFGTASSSPTYAVVVLGSQSRDSDVVSLVSKINK
ncbi:MAG: hypothetical protein WCO48_02375 [Candidatus Taylorbacteria bacterium]